jgi:hypothetical protein
MKIDIDAEKELLVVDGVPMTFTVLKALTTPDPNRYYRFYRKDDTVEVSCFEILDGGKK